MRHVWLFYAGLLILTTGLFWPVSRCGFTNFDDPQFVTENAHLRDGLTPAGIAWAFREPLCGIWHPVTSLSLLLNCQLFGQHAKGFHLVNLFFHATNVLLLFHVLRRMTKETWPSALVAALFAVHPLQVESVAWIAERKNVLSAVFGLLTIWAYRRFQQPERTGSKRLNYLLALFFFTLGLLSKPILVTWPFVLLLLDYWPLNRISSLTMVAFKSSKNLLKEKAPFFALSAAFSVVTIFTQSEIGSLPELSQLPIGDRIRNVPISYARYLGKLVWPSNLATPYPPAESWPLWQTIAATLALGLASLLLIRRVRQQPFLLVGWFWFLGTLVPVIGLIQVGSQSMADRYVYLPCIGFFIMLVWGVKYLTGGQPRARIVLAAVVLAAMAMLGSVTHRQLGYWQNSRLLFQHALDVTAANPVAQIKLGETLIESGQIESGLASLHAVIQSRPTLGVVRVITALALARQGKFREYTSEFDAVLRGKPDFPEAFNNLAWMLATNPDPSLRDGARAVQFAERACAITHRKQAIYLGTLAAAYAEAGQFDDAILNAKKACDQAAATGETGLLELNQKLLARYQNHQPYHDSPEPAADSAGR